MPKAKTISVERLHISAAVSSSWSDFFKNLGYVGRPGGGTQQRIRGLVKGHGIDVSHFVVQRGPRVSWTDDDLRKAVSQSSSWREVSETLNSSHTTVRRRSAHLGIGTEHFGEASKRAAPLPTARSAEADHERLRYAAEHMAIAWYTLHGFDVMSPVIPCPTDFVVTNSGERLKVQVKTSVSGYFSLVRRMGPSRTIIETYSRDDVDEFFLVDAEIRMYRIPLELIVGAQTISVNRCRNNEVFFDTTNS